ncbi:hypothetical protein LguiB_005250 [Lonicera macranthoides]
MGATLRLVLFSSVLISVFFSSTAQSSCRSYAFASNKVFSLCTDLPYLNSFLHWTYDPSLATVQIAYRQTQVDPSKWVSWAINPTSLLMSGSQALIAFQLSNGTMKAYTSPVADYQTELKEGDLSFPVSDLTATFSNAEMIIFATLQLQNTTTTLNQIWQSGPVTSDDKLGMHETSGPNVQSMGLFNLLSGNSGSTGGGSGSGKGPTNSKITKRNIHGVANAVSWGIMMPVGALIARYLKVFKSADPAWFYLHVTCQTSAYIIGIAGWATGLQLGSQSPGIQYTSHRSIGIGLFCLGTLQVFALLIRPQKDHKYRLFWNIYHHSVGYTVIILSIVNIFKGFDILNPEKKWQQGYTAIIVVLAIIAVFLEAYTWYLVVRRKQEAAIEEEKMPHGMNRTRGFNNGYDARTNGRF